jgi:hypothetical protein
MGRSVPVWFNLDVLITSEEVAEIEAIRAEFKELVVRLLPLAKRVRWVFLLGDRIKGDHGWELFREVLDTEEIDDLAMMVGYLLGPDSSITDEHVAFLKEWGRVKVLVLVAWLVSSVAGASGCGVFVSMGCRVPHQGSSI